MNNPRYAHLPFAAVMAVLIMVGMPLMARFQPKQEDDYWRRVRPKTHVAGGRLLFEDKPVAEAIVAFHTTVETTGYSYSAIASTDPDGYFMLRTFNDDGEGAAAGRHQITIQKMVPTGRIVPGTEYPGGPDFPGYPGELEMVSALPERFADTATSGLFATVTPNTQNFFLIRLTKAPTPEAAAALAERERLIAEARARAEHEEEPPSAASDATEASAAEYAPSG